MKKILCNIIVLSLLLCSCGKNKKLSNDLRNNIQSSINAKPEDADLMRKSGGYRDNTFWAKLEKWKRKKKEKKFKKRGPFTKTENQYIFIEGNNILV